MFILGTKITYHCAILERRRSFTVSTFTNCCSTRYITNVQGCYRWRTIFGLPDWPALLLRWVVQIFISSLSNLLILCSRNLRCHLRLPLWPCPPHAHSRCNSAGRRVRMMFHHVVIHAERSKTPHGTSKAHSHTLRICRTPASGVEGAGEPWCDPGWSVPCDQTASSRSQWYTTSKYSCLYYYLIWNYNSLLRQYAALFSFGSSI